jgi:hypothetical protein
LNAKMGLCENAFDPGERPREMNTNEQVDGGQSNRESETTAQVIC